MPRTLRSDCTVVTLDLADNWAASAADCAAWAALYIRSERPGETGAACAHATDEALPPW